MSALRGKDKYFSKRGLEKALLISQIISMLAIPIVLAFIGYWVQKGLQDQQVKRDYVNLAITLLAPRKEGEPKITPELSRWAVRLLNESSPVKLSHSELLSISNNGLAVGDGFFRQAGSSVVDAELEKKLLMQLSLIKFSNRMLEKEEALKELKSNK